MQKSLSFPVSGRRHRGNLPAHSLPRRLDTAQTLGKSRQNIHHFVRRVLLRIDASPVIKKPSPEHGSGDGFWLYRHFRGCRAGLPHGGARPLPRQFGVWRRMIEVKFRSAVQHEIGTDATKIYTKLGIPAKAEDRFCGEQRHSGMRALPLGEGRSKRYKACSNVALPTCLSIVPPSCPNRKPAKRLRFGKEEQRRECAPTFEKSRSKRYKACSDVVTQRRLELRTPCLKGRCSAS